MLGQILGNLKITYSETSIHEHGAKTVDVTLNNERHDFHFEDLRYAYQTLSCRNNSIKIAQEHPHAGKIKQRFNFIDENTYWVSPDNLPNSREYFIRVQD